MLTRRVKVLKSDQIDVAGTIQISPFTCSSQPLSAPQAGAAGASVQQARIVQSNQEFAILEVVCGCGCKSHIQCHYANT